MNPFILQKAGLTQTQIEVYLWLLEHGKTKASDIAKNIKRPRGVAYKALEELLWMDLVEKEEKNGKVALFGANHPTSLEKLFEDNVKKTRRVQQEFASALPDLISQFNLSSQKPGVKFYEGSDGIEKVLEDTLRSETEIYLFLNKAALEEEKSFREINEKYKTKRERLGINKKIIRVGKKGEEETAEKIGYQKITEIRYFSKKELSPFKSSIQIYDNKISYQIIDRDQIISIIIEDRHIYEMNKAWFEYMWENSAR